MTSKKNFTTFVKLRVCAAVLENLNLTIVMGKLYDELIKDYRVKEGLKTCINCGTCTAICPAAEFYRYDPRKIVDIVQSKDEAEIEKLLKSDVIWYCGECMSCVTRCPRKNAPGLIVMALRNLSAKLGFFTCSEKGRQLLPLTRMLTGNILNYGYCVYPDTFKWEDHVESGPVWKWHTEHLKDNFERLGANFKGDGPGILRKIPQESLDELKSREDRNRREILETQSRRNGNGYRRILQDDIRENFPGPFQQ